MNLKDSEAYLRPTGSKYLVGLSSAPYCNNKYPTHLVVVIPQCMSVIMMNPGALMIATVNGLMNPNGLINAAASRSNDQTMYINMFIKLINNNVDKFTDPYRMTLPLL